MTRPAAKTEQIAIRIDATQLKLIDELATAMAASGFGVELSRAAVARAAMTRGLEAMRAELLPDSGRPSKPKRK